jgi:hypothetical protein
MPRDLTRRAARAAALLAVAGACTPRYEPPPPLPPELDAIRTQAAMQAALAPYVRVGRPLDEATAGLRKLGFRCQRAVLADSTSVGPAPEFCRYHMPGSDPRAWNVLLALRGDTVVAYGVDQPPFLERYGREVLARRRTGGPMPDIGDFVPRPPGAPR